MFTNTEVLSYIYRALGTKIGRRVQIDQLHGPVEMADPFWTNLLIETWECQYSRPGLRLHFVENDCVTIDDYVVFGSEVMMCTDMHAPWVPAEYSKKMEKQRGIPGLSGRVDRPSSVQRLRKQLIYERTI